MFRKLASALFLLIGISGVPKALAQQCADCTQTITVPATPIQVLIPAGVPDNSAMPASSGLGLFTGTISGSPAGSPLPNSTFEFWCGDYQNTPLNNNSSYTPYSTYGTLPAASQNANWPKVNWILNNKQGTVGDVQRAIWIILTGTSTLPATTASDAMIAGANANPAFTPGPGQVMALALFGDGIAPKTARNRQDLIAVVPVPECGMIGDFVWQDLNYNGIQDANEPGINGVTVLLYKGTSASGSPIASTVTAVAPAGYPALPPGSSGYYQFKGLCSGDYTVVIDTTQSALNGFIQTIPQVPGNTAVDSNNNPAVVNLPTSTTIDRTIDFGFYNTTPVTLACPATTGQVGVPYSSALVASGGLIPYTFSYTGSLPGGLSLDSASGVISGTPTAAGPFTFIGKVVDKTGSAAGTMTSNCTITIAPAPSANCVVINAIQGVAISPVQLTGTGGSGGPYTFSATGLPAGLTMATDGTISGTPTVSGTFPYTVTVTDKDGHTGTFNCSVTVLPPVTSTCVVVNAIQGVAITPVTMVGSGGSGGPYTFVAAGLPAGLTMATNGTISGTPTVSGTFPYTVTVTDKDGHTGTFNCSVTVLPPVTSTCVVVNAIQGVAITPVTMVGSGGSGGPYTFVATGLPAGLTMATDGTISGTPTVSGTFPYTVTVTDKDGHTGTFNCSVTVLPPVTSTCVVVNAIQGVAITPVTMVGSGGSGGPYTFAATGLPAGLTMATNGTISGTPTVNGTFPYTVTVTDKDGHTGTFNCSVTVLPPVTSTCVVINAIQGVAITPVTMVGSGGSGGPYTFAATGLPAGLTMATDGTISGTPTVSGTFPYTVTVTDKDGHTGTFNCSVTVLPPVTSTCVVINAIQGVAITPVTMVGSGGSGGPYTFAATGLPAGLTMATNGTISGTPTVSGTFPYTVTVTDKDGHTGTFNCSVTVLPPVTSTCVVVNAIQGVAITPVTMVGSGGSGGPYTFSATGLPAGLTMATDGTISGTPTVSGTFPYTVTVTDKDGHTGTFNCSVTVLPAVTSSCVVINAIQGVAITPVTMVGSGGSGGPYTFSATGLPAGLTMATNGTISGTPTVSGTFPYTVMVTDKDGHTGTFNCSVTVLPPVTSTCVVVNAIQGVAITPVTMVGSGGSGGPYTFSATGLPAGLTMATNGTISGTPTVSGTFPYTVTITDKDGHTGTFNCSVTVLPMVTASCVVINAIQGVAITPVTMTATGGAGAPYTFSATGLPTGLTMATNGTISGTPTVSGTFPYTVTIRDKNGNVGTFNCSVTVLPAVTASCVIINAIQGVAITPVTMTATGGAGAPYTFSATGLPSGLTMASNGTISGTPSVSGTFPYTVTVTDKNGNVGIINCSVTVAPTTTVAGCTFTIGYWKNHEEVWPVTSLTLGGKVYTKAELLAILGMPTVGDSSLILAKQLIGARLNALSGASVPSAVQLAITAGDVLLALDPDRLPLGVKNNDMVTVGGTLDSYNNGKMGVSHCDEGLPVTNTASIGDRVWNDLDGDGVQDNGEAGLNGVTVQLRSGSTVLKTTTTAGDGTYFFGSLAAGTYTVCITGGVPSGFSQTYDLDGLRTANCATATVAAGQSRTDVDFGYRQTPVACTGSIGNFVWADDGDGIQESNELGIGGVTVNLRNAVTNALITSVQTAANGSYLFPNLCAGTYKVEAITPAGRQNTTANAPGSTTANDSNPNPATVTLTANQSDLTVDFGFSLLPAGGGCTYTQGYWKNHADAWPVSTLLIGSQTYTQAELLTIFALPVRGDDSIALAYQLIAAKLNALNKAMVPASVAGFITSADAELAKYTGKLPYGVKSSTISSLALNLDTYNNGGFGAAHCQ